MKMQYSYLFIIISCCFVQQTALAQSELDTTKLFNPNNHPDKFIQNDVKMFKRYIAVAQKGYAIILNNKQIDVEELSEVDSLVKSHKEEIEKDLFCILVEKATDFKRTYAVINILIKNKITDYKVIDIQQYFIPQKLIPIPASNPVVSSYKENYESYFSITINTKNFIVKLFGKETKLKTKKELDTFISNHKKEIKKILIISNENYSKRHQLVYDVFNKHGFAKFSLKTK